MDEKMALAYGSVVVLCYAFLFLLRKLSPLLRLVDHPDREDRKQHIGAPAQVGGIAVYLSVLAVTVLFFPDTLATAQSLFAAMGLLVLVGAVDDATHIPALQKLVLQCAVAGMLVFVFDVRIVTLGNIFGTDVLLPYAASVFLTMVCVIGFINAFNLADGMDGFAGGMALLTVIACLSVDVAYGAGAFAPLLALLALALLCFLTANMRSPWRRKAIVFLGDAGSLGIGVALAWFAIVLSQGGLPAGAAPAISPALVPWLLAYPVFDMMTVIVNRMLHRQPVLKADNMHLHFQIQRAGLSVQKSCMFLLFLVLSYGIAGFALWRGGLSDAALLAAWLAGAVLHFLINHAVVRIADRRFAAREARGYA